MAEAQDGDVVDGAHIARGVEPLPNGGVQDGHPAGQVAFEGLEALGRHQLSGQVALAGFVQLRGFDFQEMCAGRFQFVQGAADDAGDPGSGTGPEVGAGHADA